MISEERDWLDELREIKDGIAAQYSSFKEFFADMLKFQAEHHPEWNTSSSMQPA